MAGYVPYFDNGVLLPYVRRRTSFERAVGYSVSMRNEVLTTLRDEGERLKAAELAAEQRYYGAVENSDLSAMRVAADDWIRAGDALSEYLAKPIPIRNSG
jgi:hypothetical protein